MKSKLKTHTNIKRGGLVACALIGSLLWANCWGANTWYCDPDAEGLGYDGTSPTYVSGSIGPFGKLETVIAANEFTSYTKAGVEKNSAGVIKPGDTVYLLGGYHGNCAFSAYYNLTTTKIIAYEDEQPQLRRIYINGGSDWVFDGLYVGVWYSGSYDNVSNCSLLGQVTIEASASAPNDITVTNCHISSCSDEVGATWEARDLKYNCRKGIYAIPDATSVHDANFIFTDNTIRWVAVGMHLAQGTNMTVTGNDVRYICADGIPCSANDVTIDNNVLSSFIVTDENHGDAIQFHRGGDTSSHIDNATVTRNRIYCYQDDDPIDVYNLIRTTTVNSIVDSDTIFTLTDTQSQSDDYFNNWFVVFYDVSAGNTTHDGYILDYTEGVNPTIELHDSIGYEVAEGDTVKIYQKWRSPQGICGFGINLWYFTVENNLVVINGNIHGISLFALKESYVVNNTIFNPLDDGYTTRINVMDGPYNTMDTALVRNNLVPNDSYLAEDRNITADHNLTMVDANDYFVSLATDNFRLKSTATNAIDQGSNTLAPAIDWEGQSRPNGGVVDIGFDEWYDTTKYLLLLR